MNKESDYRRFLQSFDLLTKNSEDYVTGVNQSKSENSENVIKNLLKNFYDVVKSTEDGKISKNALPELLIDKFDEEQIWQEIELLNTDYSRNLSLNLPRLRNSENKITFPTRKVKKEKQIDPLEDIEDNRSNFSGENDEEECFVPSAAAEKDDAKKISKKSKKKAKNSNLEGNIKDDKKVSLVDDDFFKLSEMEEFLLAAEKSENAENNEDSEDEVDYFDDIPSEDEVGDKKKLRYKDFFADPSGGTSSHMLDEKGVGDEGEDSDDDQEGSVEDEDDSKDGEVDDDNDDDDDVNDEIDYENDNIAEKMRLEMENSDEESENEEFEDDEKMETDSDSDALEKSDSTKPKSTMELREERLKKKIKELEEKAISDKPWQMKGEISADSRPQNSLLEEVLEFDMTAKPAPVMTEATTERLEDIIIRRIKDKAWDDVERKVKPVENISEFKKRLVLDQEKSKESLAEIYEKEFIKQRDAAASVGLGTPEFKEPEEPPEHKKIKSMMVSLFSKLDALSNYHYTPLPHAPDVKIVNNLPAITMEEVAPVTATDANLLAPEEVLGKKKRELMSKEERTATDRKRERRKKKKFQRVKKLRLDQKERENKDKPQKFTKAKAFENLKKLSKFKNVKVVS
ncbi:U3 small nucleolar ribonucleoprotein protein MPP10 [Nilaparvata lugens]|uniref:U3 small nucleolar ribonucleoprotein protein MPP10 n=1 Tax=Nilaparvata lugens TaxID=108931 RepID=UPI00193DB6D6|nr:U3 small nucleolar ribonucleoprotein protein MPP10 [Nilaparvata lugens]